MALAVILEEKVRNFPLFLLNKILFFFIVFLERIIILIYRSFFKIEKYLVPGPNVVEDHSLSPAGQYSPAPVIVQTTYNYRYCKLHVTNLSSLL